MREFVVGNVEEVTVDAKSGETRLRLRPDGLGMYLDVHFSRAQAEELCDKLYDGFCALLARDDARHEQWVEENFVSWRFDAP